MWLLCWLVGCQGRLVEVVGTRGHEIVTTFSNQKLHVVERNQCYCCTRYVHDKKQVHVIASSRSLMKLA